MEETRRILEQHLAIYPRMTPQDAAKLLYQNEFGPAHLIQDPFAALEQLQTELTLLPHRADPGPPVIDIGNGFTRLDLRLAASGRISARTLGHMFMATAQTAQGNLSRLQAKLALLRELPFPQQQVDAFLAGYAQAGYPSLHHSPQYTAVYAPAYRVVKQIFARYLALFSQIDALLARGGGILAVDGRCAAGKTTLAAALAQVYGCPVFPMDDFFLPPEKRTQARYAAPGGNVDWERFREEVLLPYSLGKEAVYRPFDCHTMAFCQEKRIPHASLAVVEGSYSLHPQLREFYALKVFLSVPPKEQLRRIAVRNGPELVPVFRDKWIPLEERYIASCGPDVCADLVMEN